jgi:lipopolysaccharide biosynthesis glycosyltransferase
MMQQKLNLGETNLVIAADRLYLYPSLVLMSNLLTVGVWNDPGTKVWFLAPSGNLKESDMSALNKTIQLLGVGDSFEYLEVDLESLPETHGYLTKTTLIRLLLPKLMGQANWLWVDCDVIFTSNWLEIKEAFFPEIRRGTIVAAECHDVDQIRQQLSGNPLSSYFNAGVISWSSENRDFEGGELLNNYLRAMVDFFEGGIVGDDQDALNAVHKGDLHLISGRFNAYGDYLSYNSNPNDISVAHFAGATKPWHLIRRAKLACLRTSPACPWSPFFSAENDFHSLIAQTNSGLRSAVRELENRSRKSGKPDWKIDWFSRLASLMPTYLTRFQLFQFVRSRKHAHPLH